MNWQKIKKHDWAITVICLLLMALGLLVIFSTTYNTSNIALGAGDVSKQIIFIIIGFLAYFVILSIDFSWFENSSIIKILYLVIVLLLIWVKFFGTTIAGTNRWINIGFFNLQPSEYAKILIIIVTAAMFAAPRAEPYMKSLLEQGAATVRKKKLQLPGWFSIFSINPKQLQYLKLLGLNALAVIPLLVLTLIEPSLGNAVIGFLIWFIILIVLFPDQKQLFLMLVLAALVLTLAFNLITVTKVGETLNLAWNYAPNLWLLLIPVAAIAILAFLTRTKVLQILLITCISIGIVAAGIFAWNRVLTNYQKTRIDTFMAGPESDPQGAGYQVIQSRIAIGSGELTGRGFLQGTQSSLNVLTQASTDFVYAAFAEQFGFIGTLILLGLYTVLILRIIKTGLEAPTNFGKYLALGIALLILLHVFINIGMNLGALPVTGIPLPLMSYGGSSVLMVMISLGLVQSINTSRKSVDIADNLMLISHSLIVKEK